MWIRGAFLIRSRTYQTDRRRLSKKFMGGVHLKLFLGVYLQRNGGVYIKNKMKAFIYFRVTHIKWADFCSLNKISEKIPFNYLSSVINCKN